MLSVKDCGAIGDGITNDYQAFLTALENSSNIYIPSGVYNLGNNTLEICKATRLIGELSANVSGQVSKIISNANPVIHTQIGGYYVEAEHLQIIASIGNTTWKNECNHLYTKELDLRGGAIGLHTIQSVAGRYLNSQFIGSQYGWLANPDTAVGFGTGGAVFNTNTVIGVTCSTNGTGTGLKITGLYASRNNTFINLDCSINNIGIENGGYQNTFIESYSETIGTAHVIEDADATSFFIQRAFVGAGTVLIDSTSSNLNSNSGTLCLEALKLKNIVVGSWTSVCYNPLNFYGNGGLVWTVDESDVLDYKYSIINNVMTVSFCIANSSISGVLNSQLLLKIPGNYISASRTFSTVNAYNNGVESVGVAQVLTNGTSIILYKNGLLGNSNWLSDTNATAIAGQIMFEIY